MLCITFLVRRQIFTIEHRIFDIHRGQLDFFLFSFKLIQFVLTEKIRIVVDLIINDQILVFDLLGFMLILI